MSTLVDDMILLIEGPDAGSLAALGEADLDDALSRAVAPEDPGREQALGILAAADPEPGGRLEKAVKQILEPELESAYSATTVANALAFAAALGSAAVPLVLGALGENEDEMVALAGWRTLAQVASGEDLGVLEAALPEAGVVAEEAAFTLSVVAYRARIPGHELYVPEGEELIGIAEGEGTSRIYQGEPTAGDLEALGELGPADLFGLDPSGTPIAIDCGQNHMLLCVDPSVEPDTLGQAPVLVGVVLLLDPVGGGLSARYLAMTWPDGAGGIHLALYEPDASGAYYGHAEGEEISATEVSFDLAARDKPGAERVSLSVSLGSAGASLGSEGLSATETWEDRAEPDLD